MVHVLTKTDRPHIDRYEKFRDFASRRAEKEVLESPTLLTGESRRLHVRETMREDNVFRIQNRPAGAHAKFDKLTSSLFKFFRGSALLFHRDIAGTDAHLPTVLCIGDIHPENFGVMPNRDGAPLFGINDYDEGYFAPFSWDIKRGSVGVWIAGRENGFSKKKRRKVVAAFVGGYLDGLKHFAAGDREKSFQYRMDNSPELIRDLLESAQEARREFLSELIDLENGKFLATDEVVPKASDVDKFQEVIDDYREENDIEEGSRAGHFKVKDVAIKKGSGTASLGLDRYFVLIDGPTVDHADDLMLELKQTRRSALAGLVAADVEGEQVYEEGEAERVVKSQQVHLVGGDPYFGHVTIDDTSFLVKQRGPLKDDIDIDELSPSTMKEYAGICGKTLAAAHARSDEDSGIMEGDAEKRILSALNPEVFTGDIVRFTEEAARKLKRDYRAFCKDYELGVFDVLGEA